MSNVVRTGGRQFQARNDAPGGVSTHVHGSSNSVINNITNVTVNICGSTSTTCPFGHESMAHIPPDAFKTICKYAGEAPAEALRLYVETLHFNPCAQQNFNVCVPEEGAAWVYMSMGGNRWYRVERQQAIKWLIDDRGVDMTDWMNEHPGAVPVADEVAFTRFCKKPVSPELRTSVEEAALRGSRYVRAVHGPRLAEDAPLFQPRERR